MCRQIYSFDGANKASKRTKVNNVAVFLDTTVCSVNKDLYNVR